MTDRPQSGPCRGFILQAGYRVQQGRPVVHLAGVLEGGGSFLARDSRQRPHFWVPAAEAARAAGLGARLVDESPPRRSMHGDAVARVETGIPSEVPPLRERLRAEGIACFEADVRFASRRLIDLGIRGSLTLHGHARPGERYGAVFDDPDMAPAEWSPELSVLAVDIETDPRGRRLLSVALSGCGAEEVLLLTPPGWSCPESATPCADEGELLDRLAARVRELDPDVLTGWNVIDFDLAVLDRTASRLGRRLLLGRDDEPLRLRLSPESRHSGQATVSGRVVLDGIALMRGAFIRMESYALDAVAREVLGEGKLMHGPGRAEAILDAFRRDRPGLAAYNLQDARLVQDIMRRLRLVELAVSRCHLTGLTPDRVTASVAAFDQLYLSELSRRRIVAPSAAPDAGFGEVLHGGHVLEPEPGLYRHVCVFDFKSLYPSLIRTFQIDPLGLMPSPAPGDDPIRAPNGACFRRRPGILPGLLDRLFPQREAAQRRGDAVASQAIKILMNSFYGVLGTSSCRFASSSLSNAITGFGREILLWSRDWLEQNGAHVIYGDTDSLFALVAADDATPAPVDAAAAGEATARAGARLAAALNAALAAHVERTWRVESRLELQFEKLYLRLLLPSMRHGGGGARKRYAGLVADGSSTRVVFTGMESVRRDWTDLARGLQREIYDRLFHDRPLDGHLRRVVSELRAGRMDAALVYRKALRKDLADYTAATPPHVAAARKSRRPPAGIVAYVMTVDGPEPADERAAPLDHEHYVQKQVRPIAEPILELLGLEFDRVIGDDSQMKLF